MVIAPHMLVGAAVGSQASNVWLAFCFGLLSHFLIDALPHWDYLKGVDIGNPNHLKKIALDFILGTGLVLILIWSESQKLFILIAITGALLPDFLEVAYENFNIKLLRPFSRFHDWIHYHKTLSFWQGLPFTLIVSLIAVLLLVLK